MSKVLAVEPAQKNFAGLDITTTISSANRDNARVPNTKSSKQRQAARYLGSAILPVRVEKKDFDATASIQRNLLYFLRWC